MSVAATRRGERLVTLMRAAGASGAPHGWSRAGGVPQSPPGPRFGPEPGRRPGRGHRGVSRHRPRTAHGAASCCFRGPAMRPSCACWQPRAPERCANGGCAGSRRSRARLHTSSRRGASWGTGGGPGSLRRGAGAGEARGWDVVPSSTFPRARRGCPPGLLQEASRGKSHEGEVMRARHGVVQSEGLPAPARGRLSLQWQVWRGGVEGETESCGILMPPLPSACAGRRPGSP